MNNDYRYFVACRNPDWDRSTTELNAEVIEANPGYHFDNYGTVKCEELDPDPS